MLLRKRKRRDEAPLHLLGADEEKVADCDGSRPLQAYSTLADRRAVTLTRREADLIALANPGIAPPDALEDLHPWLPDCRYLGNAVASLQAAEVVLHRYGRHLVSASSYCDVKWNTVCNALRQRTGHDARFHAAWHVPIQEAWVLAEARPDRSVIAIDFNGMYPACMQHVFPRPADLRLVQINADLNDVPVLATGLYRCILEQPVTDFIRRHVPFRSFHSGRYLRTSLDEPVEIDLNDFELDFFRSHFGRIRLLEAVVADRTVTHPLAKEARRSFARRTSYRRQGNRVLADREKYLSTLLASCSSRPARPRRAVGSWAEALSELSMLYGIDVPIDEPEAATEVWLDGRKGVIARRRGSDAEVQGPDLRGGSACHLLGQRIIARGRIVLLEMMERILARVPDVLICYANIDSIHFSLPTSGLDEAVSWLMAEASGEMGSFKVEAVTCHGLWLEPGRYWLHDGERVEKYRNRSIGDQSDPFRDHSVHVASRRVGELHVPVRATLRMGRTMSPLRGIEPEADGVVRQRLIQVGETTKFSAVLDEIENNQRIAVPARMRAFEDLKERMNVSGDTASWRGDATGDL